MKTLRSWRGFIIFSLIFFGLFFLIGFFSKYHWPRIKAWALIEIESYSQAHLPVRVWPQDLELAAFPPRIIFRDIQILPKEEISEFLAPAKIDEVEVSLSLWGLLTGQLRIGALKLSRPKVSLALPETPETAEPRAPPSLDLEEILKLPIDSLIVEQAELMIYTQPQHLALRTQDFSFSIDNRGRLMVLFVEAPDLTLLQIGSPLYAKLSAEARILLDSREIRVPAFKIQRDESYAVGFGRTDFDWKSLSWSRPELRLRSHLDLAEFRHWMDLIQYEPLPPEMSGLLQMDLTLISQDKAWPEISYELTSQGLKIDRFEVGQVNSQGQLADGELTATSVAIENSAGRMRVENFKLNWEEKITTSGLVQVESLELRRLLNSLGVGDAPLRLPLTGQAPCEGEIHPQLQLTCRGQVQSDGFILFQDNSLEGLFVQADQIRADGQVQIFADRVSYSAEAYLGENSRGRSSGEVIYDKGFNVDFEGDLLDFSEVQHLVGLKLEGQAKVKGSAEGDSRRATTRMNIEAENFWLEDYGLGDLSLELRYAQGNLNFRNIQGLFRTSRYSGHMTLNLRQQQLFLDAQSPFLDLEDLRQVFSRQYLVPVRAMGTGSASLRAWGPLQFSELNYELNSTFFRGAIAEENFDELFFNVTAENGRARTERVQVVRGNSLVNVVGSLHPASDMELSITGRNLRLEEFDLVSRLGLNLLGQLDFQADLSGEVLDPSISFSGQFSRLTMADRAVEDSQLQFRLTPNWVQGNAQLLGEVIQAEFTLPLKDDAPFHLNLNTQEWDITHLFSMFATREDRRDFQTRLTGAVQLSAAEGGLWKSTGSIQLREFELRRGPNQIRSLTPLEVRVNQGLIQPFTYSLEGPNSVLNLSTEASHRENLRANLNGRIDLGLLAFLTPFLEDLRGDLSISVSSSGPIDDIQLLGSAYLENGTLRLNEFPHPFENLRADLLFSQKNILINALRSQLAGGQLTGDGRIEIRGLTEVPINIKGRFQNVNLNFPENIRTRGSGQVTMTGDWFPYTLGINYRVTSGEFTQELMGTGGGPATALISPHLPDFLIQDRFDPIVLDLNIQLVNPIRIRNSMVDSLIGGQLQVKGSPEAPLLTGSLNPLAGGQLIFRDNTFDIITGFVNYQSSPPETPQIYLTAQARITESIQVTEAQRPQEYEISLLIQGKAPDLEIRLSSQPPLTEPEIVSLLALGLISPDSMEQGALGQPSLQIGSAILQRPLSRELRDRLGVDVQVTSTIVDNASVPKVTVGKQWTPRWGSTASRTIEKNPTQNVTLEYKVNRNLSVVGSWEGREEAAGLQQERTTVPNRLGLDLEYKVEFR